MEVGALVIYAWEYEQPAGSLYRVGVGRSASVTRVRWIYMLVGSVYRERGRQIYWLRR